MDNDGTPKVLDLFGGVGGTGFGLERGGLRVLRSVDIADQPDNPLPFVKADVFDYVGQNLEFIRSAFHLINAAPPCQYGAAISKGTNKRLRHTYPNLYPRTREILEAIGLPYIIENPDARPDVVLCGEMFGLKVIRHRNFELGGWKAQQPPHIKHRGRVLGMRHGKLITPETGGYYYSVYGDGGYKGTVQEWQSAMGIDWTDNRKSIAEAIPPAYGAWLGQAFLTHLGK